MNFHIEIYNKIWGWGKIASFENLFDCEDCKSFLAEKYEDYAFRVKDGLEEEENV